MAKKSAGLLIYQLNPGPLVLLVHPGGPFFRNKDEGAWSIPKGEFDAEDPLEKAIEEFFEETGNKLNTREFSQLEPVKLAGGKIIQAWACMDSFEKPFISSNTFELEWPPGSGTIKSFPEVDKAEWFDLKTAEIKLNKAQVSFISQLRRLLSHKP